MGYSVDQICFSDDWPASTWRVELRRMRFMITRDLKKRWEKNPVPKKTWEERKKAVGREKICQQHRQSFDQKL
jgi:hypothetical protein